MSATSTIVRPARIVGIVADAVDSRPDLAPDPQVFLPAQVGLVGQILVRPDGDGTQVIPAVQTVVRRVWGTAADRQVALENTQARATAAWRARTTLIGFLARAGLPMAVIGLTGALAYATRQRTRELAIRIALGAEPKQIGRRGVSQALACAAMALLAGLALGAAVGRWASSLLFGVRPIDAGTVAAVTVLLAASAALAAFVPARRAARVDPASVLRDE